MNSKDFEKRLIRFATRVFNLSEKLPTSIIGKHLGAQIIRSASSPALNYGEAQAAESREDFLHKMKICLKELRETSVCLKLISERNWFPDEKLNSIIQENDELVSIFVASTKTISKNKINRKS
ncbi:MAG: four helix bundle protein [Lewinellaceae bacterium]|nr:four helix bundle protein [Saprospiraceae bacterium]MCB9343256.1 four helix bundle protein [Lewinellaceae bacterium]